MKYRMQATNPGTVAHNIKTWDRVAAKAGTSPQELDDSPCGQRGTRRMTEKADRLPSTVSVTAGLWNAANPRERTPPLHRDGGRHDRATKLAHAPDHRTRPTGGI